MPSSSSSSSVSSVSIVPKRKTKRESPRLQKKRKSLADLPTANKKKKKTKKPKKPRAPRTTNYTEEEEKILSQAFCCATTDPLVGTDQKGQDFWKKVKANFDILLQKFVEESGSDLAVKERTHDSLMHKFQRQIQKDVQLFNSYFLNVHNGKPSGWTKEMKMIEAADRFNEAQGRAFKFMHCVDILQAIPKFDPLIAGELEEDGDEAPVHNQLGNTMGGKMERPIGTKSAKKMERDNRSLASNLASIEDKKLASIDKLGEATEKLAMASYYQGDTNVLMQQIQFYQSIGSSQLAAECMNQLKERQAEQRAYFTKVPDSVATPPTVAPAPAPVAFVNIPAKPGIDTPNRSTTSSGAPKLGSDDEEEEKDDEEETNEEEEKEDTKSPAVVLQIDESDEEEDESKVDEAEEKPPSAAALASSMRYSRHATRNDISVVAARKKAAAEKRAAAKKKADAKNITAI